MTWVRNRGLLSSLLRANTFPSLSRTRHAWTFHHRRCLSTQSSVTPVEKLLLDTIKATGPISFATYMQLCLSHPTEGYYMKSADAVIGSQGDFITSPEISQVFGELLGVWLLSQWMYAGASRPIRLVELGPGRGTLMHDVLRVFSQIAAARKATEEIHLVETSPSMRAAQEAKLGPIAQEKGWKFSWHDAVTGIPHDASKFTLVLAHELFDALPFHLLQKTPEGWREVLIASGADPAEPTTLKPGIRPSLDVSTVNPPPSLTTTATRFRRILSKSPSAITTLLGLSSPRFEKLPLNSRIEVSPAGFKIARQIGELLYDPQSNGARSAGSALIVDYGGDKVYGNSFRAFKDHKIVDVFHRPGECDLTVNVDFAYLREAAADFAAHHGPISQAMFLQRMGLGPRVAVLTKAARDEERKRAIERAADRLVDPTGMGTQYKVMGLTGKRTVALAEEERWPFVGL